MVSDKNYRFSLNEIENIKQIMANFTPNYQHFIENTYKIKLWALGSR